MYRLLSLPENDFLYYWDDQWCVINPYTSGGLTWENLYRIFTETHGGQYSPLNEIGYVLIYSLFGYSPVIFHLAGLGVHLLNVVLLYFFLSGLLTQSSRLTTMYNKQIRFSGYFVMGSPSGQRRTGCLDKRIQSPCLYIILFNGTVVLLKIYPYGKVKLLCGNPGFSSLFLFRERTGCGISIMFITGRFCNRQRTVSPEIWEEKLPFLLLSLYMGTIPILAQGFRREELDYPLIDRVVFATYSLIEYLTKCLIPIKLSYLYPFPMLPGYAMPFRFWFLSGSRHLCRLLHLFIATKEDYSFHFLIFPDTSVICTSYYPYITICNSGRSISLFTGRCHLSSYSLSVCNNHAFKRKTSSEDDDCEFDYLFMLFGLLHELLCQAMAK